MKVIESLQGGGGKDITRFYHNFFLFNNTPKYLRRITNILQLLLQLHYNHVV